VILVLLGVGVVIAASSCGHSGQEPSYIPAYAERSMDVAGQAAPEPEAGDAQDGTLGRAVARQARMAVKVDDFMAAREQVRKFIEERKGFFARSDQKRESESSFSGTLILQVPEGVYVETLDFLQKLGKVYELSEQAEDLTDQVADLDVRLRNARKLEERILALIADKTGNIGEVIEAERELASVRQRIEEMEARQKAALTRVKYAAITVNLFVSSSRDVEARTWYGPLLHDLRDLGFVVAGSLGALLTAIVAAVPWVLAIWALSRWWKRRRERRRAPVLPNKSTTIE